MQHLRTFLAVDLSPAVKTRVEELIDRWSESDAKVQWVGREQMHLTLNFLGDVPAERTPEICRIAQEVARSHAPFPIQIKNAGSFGPPDSPRVVWLGVEDGIERLKTLQRNLDDGLSRAGFSGDGRAYAPHLTLGRVKKTVGSPEDLLAWISRTRFYNAGPSRVEEVLVFSSMLEREGPIHHVMARAPLGG